MSNPTYKHRIEEELGKLALAVSIEWVRPVPNPPGRLDTVIVESVCGGVAMPISWVDAMNPDFPAIVALFIAGRLHEFAREKLPTVAVQGVNPLRFANGEPIYPDRYPPAQDVALQDIGFVSPVALKRGDVIITNAFTGEPLCIERRGKRIWQDDNPLKGVQVDGPTDVRRGDTLIFNSITGDVAQVIRKGELVWTEQ